MDSRLKVGDKLVSVNGTSVVNHSLQVSLHLSEVVHHSPPPPLPFCSPPLPPLLSLFVFFSSFSSFLPCPLLPTRFFSKALLPPSSPHPFFLHPFPHTFSLPLFQFAVQQLVMVPLGGVVRLGVNHPVPASPEINSSPGSPLVFFMDTQIMAEDSAHNHNTLYNVRTCMLADLPIFVKLKYWIYVQYYLHEQYNCRYTQLYTTLRQ